jgi:hypothetical protein
MTKVGFTAGSHAPSRDRLQPTGNLMGNIRTGNKRHNRALAATQSRKSAEAAPAPIAAAKPKKTAKAAA